MHESNSHQFLGGWDNAQHSAPFGWRRSWASSYEHHAFGLSNRRNAKRVLHAAKSEAEDSLPRRWRASVLSESVAISRYLIERYGSRKHHVPRPDCLAARAKEDEWVCYIYGELDETSLYVMRRHGDLERNLR